MPLMQHAHCKRLRGRYAANECMYVWVPGVWSWLNASCSTSLTFLSVHQVWPPLRLPSSATQLYINLVQQPFRGRKRPVFSRNAVTELLAPYPLSIFIKTDLVSTTIIFICLSSCQDAVVSRMTSTCKSYQKLRFMTAVCKKWKSLKRDDVVVGWLVGV